MKSLILSACLLSSFLVYPQTEAVAQDILPGKPHFVSFNFGYNYPTGDFKEMKFDTTYSAETEKGYYGSMEFGFYFNRFLGLGINIGAFYNEVDEEKFRAQVMNDLAQDAMSDPNKGYAEADINTSEWINVYAMAGPYVSIPILSRFYVDFKFLVGAMSTNEPLLKLRIDQAGDVSVSKNGEANAIGFGFNYGVHLRAKIVSKLGLRLNFEAFNTQQDIESSYNNGNGMEFDNKYSKKISAYNIGAGLVFTFD